MIGHPDLDCWGHGTSGLSAIEHEDAVGGNELETVPWKFNPCLWGEV